MLKYPKGSFAQLIQATKLIIQLTGKQKSQEQSAPGFHQKSIYNMENIIFLHTQGDRKYCRRFQGKCGIHLRLTL